MADQLISSSQLIKPKTPEMESFLKAGYPDLDVETAKRIIKEREANPLTWPFEEYMKAKAFLAAYNGVPVEKQIVSSKPGLYTGYAASVANQGA